MQEPEAPIILLVVEPVTQDTFDPITFEYDTENRQLLPADIIED